MNWDQIQGDWMQFKGKVRKNWVKLTDEDLTRIGGRRDELARPAAGALRLCQGRSRARNRSLDEDATPRGLTGLGNAAMEARVFPVRNFVRRFFEWG